MTAGSRPAAYVELTEAAAEDLQILAERSPVVVEWALKKMILLERDPYAGEPLLGILIGWRKLVVGDRGWRIVWRVRQDETGDAVVEIAEVWAIGVRSDAEVYEEMKARVAMMPPDQPQTVALASAVEQLGRRAAGITPAVPPPVVEPVPDWLFQRLVHTVGMEPDDVNALSLEKAVDAWTDWCSRPH